MGEFERDHWAASRPFMDAEGVQLQMLHMACYEITREAIVNRLIDMLPNPQPDGEGPDSVDGSHAQGQV